jgi:preprotein translocase subunit SecF
VSVLNRLYRGETTYDFVQHRRTYAIVSGILLTISVLSLLVFGLKGSIDFTGGTLVDTANTSGRSVGDYRNALTAIGQGGARVQLTGENQDRVLISTGALDNEDQDRLVEVVAETAGVVTDDVNLDAVGPTFGGEITRRAIEALVIFLIVVSLFITWRFEWKMAGGALAALFHDLLITAGIYSLARFEVTPATVIAILTILGYSLYDTVVVFDKITENVHELGNRHTFTEIANLSTNQVLMRSVNTSLTSLLPVGSLLFVGSYLLGAATLREFALALFIGIAVGTYSSIFVATPLLALWKEQEPEWQRMQRRAARRSGDATASATTAPDVAVETVDVGAVARPPRQRKKRR